MQFTGDTRFAYRKQETVELSLETENVVVSHNVTPLRIERWQHLTTIPRQAGKGHGRTSII